MRAHSCHHGQASIVTREDLWLDMSGDTEIGTAQNRLSVEPLISSVFKHTQTRHKHKQAWLVTVCTWTILLSNMGEAEKDFWRENSSSTTHRVISIQDRGLSQYSSTRLQCKSYFNLNALIIGKGLRNLIPALGSKPVVSALLS